MKRLLTLIFFITAFLGFQVMAQDSKTLENFEDVKPYTTGKAPLSEVAIQSVDDGLKGKALKIDFDLTKDNYVYIIRDLSLDFSKVNYFKWYLKGDANNTLFEFKLQDKDGATFGKKILVTGLSKDHWKKFYLSRQDCNFMWGGYGYQYKNWEKVVTLSLAVSRGEAKKGYVVVDEMGYNEKGTNTTVVLEGTVEDTNGNPVKNAECRLIPSLDTGAKVIKFGKTDDFGAYCLTNDSDQPLVLSINKWGYHPSWDIIKNDQNQVQKPVVLTKYSIPRQIDKVELVLDPDSQKKIYPATAINDHIWSVKVPVNKGDHTYAFKINGEVYPYPDLNNKEFKYNKGDYIAFKKISEQSSDMEFNFDAALYDRIPETVTNANTNTWQASRFWMERTMAKTVEADKFLLDKVKAHKVVFLGKSDREVSSIIFLAHQLKKLYSEGNLRTIFLEFPIPVQDIALECGNFSFEHKEFETQEKDESYEWIYLYKAIDEINREVPDKDKIRIIYAKEGMKPVYSSYNIYINTNVWQERDDFAYSTIARAVDSSSPQEKFIVFYGSEHGAKKDFSRNYGYKTNVFHTLGSRLADKLKQNYYSIQFNYSAPIEQDELNENLLRKYYFDGLKDGNAGFELDGTVADKKNMDDRSGQKQKTDYFFDAVISLNDYRIGIPSVYAKNKITIKLLMDTLKMDYIMLKSGKSPSYYTAEMASTAKFLKMHLKDRFSYSYWSSSVPLKQAILQTEKWYDGNKDKIQADDEKEICNKEKIVFSYLLGFSPSLRKNRYFTEASPAFPDEINNYILGYSLSIKKDPVLLDAVINHFNFLNSEFPEYFLKESILLSENKVQQDEITEKLSQLSKDIIIPNTLAVLHPSVFEVSPDSSLYGKLQFADLILELNGKPIKNSLDFENNYNKKGENRLKVLHDNSTNNLNIVFKKDEIAIFDGVRFFGKQPFYASLSESDSRVDCPDKNPSLRLSPEIKKIYLSLVSKLDAPEDRCILDRLVQSSGFSALSNMQQVHLLLSAGARNEYIGPAARTCLGNLIRSSHFTSSASSEQTRILQSFLNVQPWLPESSQTARKYFPDLKKSAYRIEPVQLMTNFNFKVKSAPAICQNVVLETGEKLSIYIDKENIPSCGTYLMVNTLADAFASLPKQTRKYLRSVMVSPDFTWGFMSVADTDCIRINYSDLMPLYMLESPWWWQQRYNRTLAYHVASLLGINIWKTFSYGYDNNPVWTPWKTAMQSDALSPSQYGKYYPGFDMAEMVNLYTTYSGTPYEQEIRDLFPARMKIVDDLLSKAEAAKP